jgi:hypothetical protein
LGPRIRDLEVKSCQSKRFLLDELSGVRDGIVVVACLDLIAAEAAKKAPQAQDRAIELAFNHIIWKIVDVLEEADGKLVCGIVAPIFWKEHSELVRDAMHHAYRVAQKAPVPNLLMTDYLRGMKVGGDQVHLVQRAGEKYVATVNDVFKQIDQDYRLGLVHLEEKTVNEKDNWADDSAGTEDEPGFELVPPRDPVSPSKTLSMVSASMLATSRPNSMTAGSFLRESVLTGSNLVTPDLGSGALPGPYTGPFRVPPPRVGMIGVVGRSDQQGQPTPASWPTMITPELSASLTRIEQRVGYLETKSFFDNLTMASLQEECDTEANRAMLNKVTLSGIKIPNLQRMSENEKVSVMRRRVQEIVDKLENEGQKFEVVFVRHLNRFVKGFGSAVIEVKFASEKQAVDLRSNFVKKRKDTTEVDSINIAPVVRLATRVRVEMMHAISNALKQHDPTIEKAFCMQFIPKPMIKIIRKDSSGNEMAKNMSFLEAVSWVKENSRDRSVDFKKAYEKAGSAFRGTLQQTFVVLQ